MIKDLGSYSIQTSKQVQRDDITCMLQEREDISVDSTKLFASNSEYGYDYDEDSFNSFDDTIVQDALLDATFTCASSPRKIDILGVKNRFRVHVDIVKLELYSILSNVISEILKEKIGKRGNATIDFSLQYRCSSHIHGDNDHRGECTNRICQVHVLPTLHLTAAAVGEAELDKYIRMINARLPRTQKIMHSSNFCFSLDSHPNDKVIMIELVMKIHPSRTLRNRYRGDSTQKALLIACASLPVTEFTLEQRSSVHSKIDLRLTPLYTEGGNRVTEKANMESCEAIGSISVQITLSVEPEYKASSNLQSPLHSTIKEVSVGSGRSQMIVPEKKEIEGSMIKAPRKSISTSDTRDSIIWIALRMMKITGNHSSDNYFHLRLSALGELKFYQKYGARGKEKKISDSLRELNIFMHDGSLQEGKHDEMNDGILSSSFAIYNAEGEQFELGDSHRREENLSLAFELWGSNRLRNYGCQQTIADGSFFYGTGLIPITLRYPHQNESIAPPIIKDIDVNLSGPSPIPINASFHTAVGSWQQIRIYPLLCVSAVKIQRIWRAQKEKLVLFGCVSCRNVNIPKLSVPLARYEPDINSVKQVLAIANAVHERKVIEESSRENDACYTGDSVEMIIRGSQLGGRSTTISGDSEVNKVGLYPPFHLCIRVGKCQGLKEILTLWLEHNELRSKWITFDSDPISDSFWLLSNAVMVTFRVYSGCAVLGWHIFSSDKKYLHNFINDPNFNFQASALCQLSDDFLRYLRSSSITFTLWFIPSTMTEECSFQIGNDGEADIPSSAIKICHANIFLPELLDSRTLEYSQKCPWCLSFPESDGNEVIGYVDVNVTRLNGCDDIAMPYSAIDLRRNQSPSDMILTDTKAQETPNLNKESHIKHEINQIELMSMGYFLNENEAVVSGTSGIDSTGDVLNGAHEIFQSDELFQREVTKHETLPEVEVELIGGSVDTPEEAHNDDDSWTERNLDSIMASLDDVRVNLNRKGNDSSSDDEAQEDRCLDKTIELRSDHEKILKMSDDCSLPVHRTLSSVAAHSVESLDQVIRELRASTFVESSSEGSKKSIWSNTTVYVPKNDDSNESIRPTGEVVERFDYVVTQNEYSDSSSSSSEIFSRNLKTCTSHAKTLGMRRYKRQADIDTVFEANPYEALGYWNHKAPIPMVRSFTPRIRSTMIGNRDRHHSCPIRPMKFLSELPSTSSSSACLSPSSCSSTSILESSCKKSGDYLAYNRNRISKIMDTYLRRHEHSKIRPSSAPSNTRFHVLE